MDETAGAVEEDVPWGRLRPHLPQNFAVFLENTAPQPLQVTSDMFVTRKTRGETRRIEKRKKEKCSIGGEGVFHDPHLKKPRTAPLALLVKQLQLQFVSFCSYLE